MRAPSAHYIIYYYYDRSPAPRRFTDTRQCNITCADDDDDDPSCVHWPHLNNDKNRRAAADDIYDLQVRRTRNTIAARSPGRPSVRFTTAAAADLQCSTRFLLLLNGSVQSPYTHNRCDCRPCIVEYVRYATYRCCFFFCISYPLFFRLRSFIVFTTTTPRVLHERVDTRADYAYYYIILFNNRLRITLII